MFKGGLATATLTKSFVILVILTQRGMGRVSEGFNWKGEIDYKSFGIKFCIIKIYWRKISKKSFSHSVMSIIKKNNITTEIINNLSSSSNSISATAKLATRGCTSTPKVREAAKNRSLVARPIRPYPPPSSSLVATRIFPGFFRISKNGIFFS